RTRPRAILRPRPTSGGTGTTATSQTQRPTRSGSRYRTPERRRSGTNTRARSHEAGLFRWNLTGGDGRSEGAAIGRSAKVRYEERSRMSAPCVRRAKAALSSGCKPHPAIAPAGSNRSSHGGNEVAEAFDYRVTNWGQRGCAGRNASARRETPEKK